MANRSKQKGDRAERAIVELMRLHGLDAYRVPLSGAASGFKSDVELRLANQTLKVESKVRSKGFANIYRWLAGSDLLVIKADYQEALAVIPIETLTKLLAQYLAKPIEKATDKHLPINPTTTIAIEPQSVSNLKPSGSTLHDVKMLKINLPRFEPLRVASIPVSRETTTD